jgi:molybdopterin-guanine dinucleotide biosynthesis protein A
MTQARQHQADIAVPISPAHGGEPERHHWTCALIHHSQAARLEGLIHLGERRVRAWITQGRWIGVSFDRADAFININAPETLHAHR